MADCEGHGDVYCSDCGATLAAAESNAERLLEAAARALETPVDGAAAIAGLMGENRKLRERVRVLEELLTDAVPFVHDAARNYGPPEAKAWLPRARAALEGIEVE